MNTMHTNDVKVTAREDIYLAHWEMSRDEYEALCTRLAVQIEENVAAGRV